ncbi:GHMP kinase [candidate division KSB3 bacterium]|uniref:GHMP kinase n=1 Tax=candidate division KSB3 bacterium TaxID=2044937 RepID=A0A2G6E5P1_9BACT|nr:MAG: GHMP kinase [candidate division KSB3 bacterium]PIE29817.1 MAG: GHMP kinase [candidate division KSB3 bacterium]
MIIRTTSYARAGLIGNPSDGYFGKTIAFSVRNFCAEVTLYESPQLEITFHQKDHTKFASIRQLVEDIKFSGYYGGIRLLKAAIKKFYEYCQEHTLPLEEKNFTILYDSNVPLRVGLAGSSAIITSVMKALMQFYNIEIENAILANLILSVEAEELGISAGLQDRVIQVYEGMVYMDFNRQHMEEYGYGIYESLLPGQLPNLYIAYSDDLSEGTEVFHNNIRQRYNDGDRQVHEAMREFGEIARVFREALMRGDLLQMNELINRNFNVRASIFKLSKRNWEMVNCARNVGASSKFCGSGGAIVGIYADENMYQDLEREMTRIRARLLKPIIFEEPGTEEEGEES